MLGEIEYRLDKAHYPTTQCVYNKKHGFQNSLKF
jgi:hypothetical protein